MSKIPSQLADNLSFIINQASKEQIACFDRQMRALNLDRAQWRVLGYLDFFHDINQSDLARLMGVGKAPLGQLIHKMEAAGWLVREQSQTDRRSYSLRAADSLAGVASRVKHLMELESERLMAGLSGKDRAQLKKLLETILSNAQGVPESPEIKSLKADIMAEMARVKKSRPSSVKPGAARRTPGDG